MELRPQTAPGQAVTAETVWCPDCRLQHQCEVDHGPDGHGGSSICCPRKREPAETTLPPMLQPETEKALKTAGRKLAEWTLERDRLVRLAVSEGGSLREVGAAAGLSHTAVKFIAHGR
jgi:hypothetical protein